MTHTKRKSKHVAAIVSAIDALATQFGKCATNFENVSHGIAPKKSEEKVNLEKQTETDLPEKSYTDWVHEMRHTTNGQKFIDRIEVSLRKALSKQKVMLQRETDVKLRHQRELLKIRYAEKLLKQPSSHVINNESGEARNIHENIEKQLKKFQEKHTELLNKINDVEISIRNQPSKEKLVEKGVELIKEKAIEAPLSPPKTTTPLPSLKLQCPVMKSTVKTQRQMQDAFESLTKEEGNANQIVLDAKLRLKELELESNKLEQSFEKYLERQKLQRNPLQKRVRRSHTYVNISEKTAAVLCGRKRTRQLNKRGDAKSSTSSEKEEEEKLLEVIALKNNASEIAEPRAINNTSDETDTNSHKFRNPILEAKVRFFEAGEHFKRNAARALGIIGCGADTFYNANFNKTESKANLENQPDFAQLRAPKQSHSKVRRKSSLRSSSTSSPNSPSTRDIHKCKRQLFASKEDINIPSTRIIRMIVDKDNIVYNEDAYKTLKPVAQKSETHDQQHVVVQNKRKPRRGDKANVGKTKQSTEKGSTSTRLQQSMEKMQQLFIQAESSKKSLEKSTENARKLMARQGCDIVESSDAESRRSDSAALLPNDEDIQHKRAGNSNHQQKTNGAESDITLEEVKEALTQITMAQQIMEEDLKALDVSVSSMKSSKPLQNQANMVAGTFGFQDEVATSAATTSATGRAQITSDNAVDGRPVEETPKISKNGSTVESLEVSENAERRTRNCITVIVPSVDVSVTSSSTSVELQLSTGHAAGNASDGSDFWR